VVFVRDGDVKSPLVVFMDDFSRSNPPVFIVERGSELVEVIGTTTEFTFDVRASRGGDTELNCIVVFGEQAVSFFVVHHHRVRLVDVWVRSSPSIVFVIVVGFDFTECFVNDELSGVFNVISVIYDDGFDFFPVPASFVEAVGFVSNASGFETASLQVVATPRINV